MTENQTPKDENSQETMNSGDLETVNNTGSDTLSQDENVADSVDFEETATPANASDNTQASETKNTNKKIKNHFDQLTSDFGGVCCRSYRLAGVVSLALNRLKYHLQCRGE